MTTTELIKRFSRVLDSFQILPDSQLAFYNQGKVKEPEQVRFSDESVSNHFPSRFHALSEADYALKSLCESLFYETLIEGEGDYSFSTSQKVVGSKGPKLGDAVVATPVSLEKDSLAKTVIFSTLYSDRSLFVLPVGMSDFVISYSSSHSRNMGAIRTLIEHNKRIEPLVRDGKAAFVPTSITFTETKYSYHTILNHVAPTVQASQHLQALPLNLTLNTLDGGGCPFGAYKISDIVLPYYQGLSFSELNQFAINESDSFLKFNYFLSDRLSKLDQAKTLDGVQSVINEIKYETTNLRIEAERLAKLRSLQMAQLSFFTVGVFLATFAEAAAVKNIAGVLGSAGLLELIRGHYNYVRERTALKKSDFYIPFLVDRRKDDRVDCLQSMGDV